MSQASKPVARTGRVAFELDRFELAGDDRWVVQGRWFGVRGRRFMRPALVLVVDGQPTRLLADLADKPWAAEDGRPWTAAFPTAIDRGQVLEAELTVAPDITIALPAPPPRVVVASTKTSSRGVEPSAPRGARSVRRSEDAGGKELASLAGEVADAEAEQARLRRELGRMKADQEEAAARTDKLLGQLSDVARERDEARAASDQRRADLEALQREQAQTAADRDAARRARDETAAERDAARLALDDATQVAETARASNDRALTERAAAIAAQKRAKSERDAAAAERDQAAAERDGARALRDHALAERDAAVAARDEAVYQRHALSRTSERLQSELANLISARGAAMVMRRAAHDRPASRRRPAVLAGAIGIILALTLVLVLLIALRGM
jgi:hypothetical protein